MFCLYLLFNSRELQATLSKNTLATLAKHLAVREKADAAYHRNVERMHLKHSKQRRVREFEVGESVRTQIDRACTDPQRLSCVVEKVGKAQPMYHLLCESGVLSCCYSASDLEPYAGSYSIPIDNWTEKPRVTLRMEAKNQAPWNVFQGNKCNCRVTVVWERVTTEGVTVVKRG